MAGWSRQRADAVKAAFYEFLNEVRINSKEDGWIILGEHLYEGQRRVIDDIFDGLAEDIHDFKILKSRQLGISTIIRALMLFWAGVFDGVTGSLVFDTAQHLDEARRELVNMLKQLPTAFEFPREDSNNRYSLTLTNQSRINLAAAGVKESKSSGTLGRGSAVSLAHRSELCSYQNTSGIEAYRASLARKNPNRLFIDESTARGPNIWKEIWEEAADDPHCRRIFIGWWSHPGQRIERDDPDFERFGIFPPTEAETAKIIAVMEQYSHTVTPEQLAWIRKEMDPGARPEGDADAIFEGTTERIQEQPWTADEAFQMTGSVFFAPETLTRQMTQNCSPKFKTFMFSAGLEFTDMRAFPASNARSVELKVWEEPVEDSVYVIAADPAFGHDEHNDRSAIQVLRCYSDGIDQVAEYAWPLINTRQFAWVIAALEGWYAGEKSEIFRIIEINGPGEAVWNELQSLKRQIATGYFGGALAERGLQNIQRNVRNYQYTRSDSMHPGRVWQFKTQTQLKIAIMERLRDFTSSGILRIRSQELLEEMRTVSRDGDSITAQGTAKDDRAVAMAMAVRAWEERARRQLLAVKRTREADLARRRLDVRDQIMMFNNNMLSTYLAGRSAGRRQSFNASRRQAWRGR